MRELRYGSLFSGYLGLDMGVQSVLGGTTAWVSDIDKGACKILAHRAPGVPNLGDITTVDWASVEPVDVLTGSSPCQDLSHAGKRQGMTEGTRSNLWVAMRETIAHLNPSLIVWENVRGAYSAEADSELVTRPGLLDSVRRRDGEPVLRALGRVLGDLSDLGYMGAWHGVRAADIGAPHGRFRVFVVAHSTSNPRRFSYRNDGAATDAQCGGWDGRTPGAIRGSVGRVVAAGRGEVTGLLPTPTSRDHKDGQIRREPHRPDDVDTLSRALTLLPTPRVTQAGYADDGRGGKSLDVEARLLPTPTSQAAKHGADDRGPGTLDDGNLWSVVTREQQWGQYAGAITRWEHVLGRPAPAPTMTSTKGNPQLSPRFVEWLMGLPEGWVTDVPGITRNEALKALGNGVVPQQAAAALRHMLTTMGAVA